MNIERRLHQLIGPAAGRLHTGRSRNDQIALDMRLYTREVISDAVAGLRGVQRALLGLARKYQAVVMPGYTHLQRAQPVLFAHHMMAYFEMFQRDIGRLDDCRRRADVLPLGSGALAGVPIPLTASFWPRIEFLPHQCQQHGRRVGPRLRGGVHGGCGPVHDALLSDVGRADFVGQRRVRVHPAGRRVHHRQQHHAPETQPRLRRAGPRQDRPRLRRTWWDC